ncbi:MAG: SpoIIE family protein phosphatase, partial [Clostridia bacterium]|nr:SpoIIE family protein phosphatase [Clostridia bacterium]
ENGYFRALICDGMGSGRDAALSSRLASLFLEKMLATDTDKGIILELLGNALMSRSGESFSSVDLFEADLLTGKAEFVKAGAAPTYILRKSKIFKIFSATPPVGIITGFTTEITRFTLEPEDVIVMVSDGAVPNNEDSSFIAELIKTDTSKDSSAIAAEIAERCESRDDICDDVSICVLKALPENL